MAIRQKFFGTGHLTVAVTLNDLAEVYSSEGKHKEAELSYLRALSIYEKNLWAGTSERCYRAA